MLAVLAAPAIFPINVLAAPGSKSVTLSDIEYQKGGIVLLFETTGLTNADLKDDSFYADSNNQKMSCNFVDRTTTVRCIVSKSLAGRGNFRATLAGFSFGGKIPEPKFGITCGEGEMPWYMVNVYQDGELVDSGPMPAWVWNFFKSAGIFDQLANEGITFKITNAFCGPHTGQPV